jgi:hypothetical protein
MAGRIVTSTINDDTGVLATQNGMTGVPKAWISFNMSTGAIRSSFNVSSVSKTTTGQYVVNLTTAMPDANYSAVGTTASSSTSFASTGTVVNSTSQVAISCFNSGFTDAIYAYLVVCGN